ncbi:MAG: 3-(3-hydroxyphenyl)propionate hydroxylase [Alphaproteobacteria bacterium]|nr:3-(3-hydroxyphenyl)propionate hydroxylase [Alphaproteobacteria bacterium]
MPENRTIEVPVLIIGAGPTGLLTANLLGTYGVECLVIERNQALTDQPKAILLDDEGLRALQAAGLAGEVMAQVILGYGARYYEPDGTCFAKIDAPVTEHGFPRRNSFLQPNLERSLLRGLERFQNVRCDFSTELKQFKEDPDGICATVTTVGGTLEIRSQVMLGCDGGRSTVREQLGIEMPGRTDSRDWVVVDTTNDPDADRFSKFFCDPERPMVSIPAPGGGRRYEYMIMPGEDPADLSKRDRVRQILGKFRTIPDEDMTRAVVYTFHARVAERLQAGRALLLGDAAHLTPPFAGQGMNAGLRDAFNVAWKAALLVGGKAGTGILGTYENERRGPIEEMIDYAVSLGEIVMPVGGFDEAARAQILDALIPARGALKPKPQAAYTAGWVMPGLGANQSLVGSALPQPLVCMPDGETWLLDNQLGPGFSLIGFGAEALEQIHALASGPLSTLSPTPFGLVPPGAQPRQAAFGTVLSVAETSPTPTPEVDNQILLVRPDRFVAAQIDPGRVGDVRNVFSTLLACKA